FTVLCSWLKRNILLLYPSNHHPHDIPPVLPLETRIFLGEACSMNEEDVEACWEAVKDVAWHGDQLLDGTRSEAGLQQTFQTHGGVLYCTSSFQSLWPPVHVCINSECPYIREKKNLKLQRTEELNVVLYSLSLGPIAVRSHQMTCEGCGIVYHPDYFVKTDPTTNERLRHYYNSEVLPAVIQVATHHFVETRLAITWRNSMLYGWTSASNCVKVYLGSLMAPVSLPSGWTVDAKLRTEYVYDSFKILSLLEHHMVNGAHLCVPQSIDQSNRFEEEMKRVNVHVRTHGQPEIDHRCGKCVRTVNDGKRGLFFEVFAVVCDGVTVGRPCCGVPHCEGRLRSTQDPFCADHAYKASRCRVTGCERLVKSKTSKACDISEHQAAERQFRERERAAFQLKQRYERQRQADEQANILWDIGAELDTGSDEVYEVVGTKRKKSSTIKAQFGRRRTHNEQLIVAPCGIILARETFYYSEGFAKVAQFTKHTFEHRRKPNHFIFDCNCILSKHVWHPNTNSEIRDFFKDIGLAVDVFHFKSKHKESDVHCGSYCNPYKFPELMYIDENGEERWFFNTSVAEQTNVWFGRYHSICREMGAVFYEFFLNQMILMHNEDKKREL
ncbi:hypothetical protein K435DRAFT_580726, partial [Dendrothele bispora CBS 962.96]